MKALHGWVATGFLCAMALPGCAQPPVEQTGPFRPHVVLIVVDSVRADAIHAYGFERPITPAIDRLAADGTRFTRAFSTSFWTLPAHASILSGLYPSQARATSESNRLPDDVLTLAELLGEAGYRTWGGSSSPWVSRERGFAQGFDEWTEGRPAETPGPAGPDAQVAQRAADWLAGVDDDAPFFLFVNINTAHLPYETPLEIAPSAGELLAAPAEPWSFLARGVELDPGRLQQLAALYAAEVAAADGHVGRVIGAVEDRGLLNQTLVILTADHGENLGEHGRIGHQLSFYDTTVRVPLIIRYPAKFERGAVDERLASLVDLFPTVGRAVGIVDAPALPYVDRSDLSDAVGRRSHVIAENDRPLNGIRLLERNFPEFDRRGIDRPMRMIRSTSHKLIHHVGREFELYDLRDDPAEERNTVAENPQVRDALYSRLQTWLSGVRASDAADPFENLDPETLEQLRSLGYVE